MKLAGHNVLERAPMLQITIEGESVEIVKAGRVLPCGKHGLQILDVFAHPLSVQNALDALKPTLKGVQDWVDLTAEISEFYEQGILLGADDLKQEHKIRKGFGALPVHVSMINDRDRTSAFLSAIRQTVQPGDIVLEIGTGVGLLAIAAAQSGARHVYAIEATGIADVARAMFEANGVADRVTLLTGWSTQIDLPEKANVLIAELIGNNIFEENLLETVRDAVRRHLTRQAKIIPQGIDILAQPLYIPEQDRKNYAPVQSRSAQWQEWYSIDFTPLLDAASYQRLSIAIAPHTARNWSPVGDALLLSSIDLRSNTRFIVEGHAKGCVQQDSEINAVMIYPDLNLTNDIRLTRHLAHAKPDTNWLNVVSLLPKPIQVRSGESYAVRYQTGSEHTSLTIELEA
jgi:hypothetical protein